MASKSRDSKSADKSADKGKAKKKGDGRSFVWVQGLLCGALATLATPLAVLLAFLLAPGIIASFLDRSPGRPVARAVLLFGAAASVAPAKQLWEGGMSMPACIQIMTDPIVFGTAWAAAAAGWLGGEIAPIIVGMVLDASRKSRAAKLEAARAKYAEEWGLNEDGSDGASA
jgi:hypothetical protein